MTISAIIGDSDYWW